MSEQEKEFVGIKENIPAMLDFIVSFANEHGFPDSFTNKMQIVGDELFSNIIRYGYENLGGPITIRLSFDEGSKEFCMVIIDEAKEFNQLAVANPAEKTLRIGGLGIFIVKNIMSKCAYKRVDGKNVLTLKKGF